MSKTGAGLAQWACDIHAGKRYVYWYGTYCNPCSDSLLRSKTKQYPKSYGTGRQATYKRHISQGKTCTDCVGLIKGYYWENEGVIKYKRDGLPDRSAEGMYSATQIKGTVANGLPEIPGILLWTKPKGHVGVYVGNGEVVEARGFAYGIQRNNLRKRGFTYWGLCPYIEYTANEIKAAKKAASAASSGTNTPTIRKGDSGEAVKDMQARLMAAGCQLPRYGADGKCGAETVAAIKAYQTVNGLKPDGICGPLTWAALGV